MRFHIFTTGCKANQWDSYVMANRLRQEGFLRGSATNADVVIVNGCTLTGRAETDIRRFIERVRSTNKTAKVVLAGCHAQVYPDRSFGADLLLGQKEKFDIAGLIGASGAVVEKTRQFVIDDDPIRGVAADRTRFFFKIQDGCDRFCTYCIVPYARGSVRSRQAAEIVEGMARLKADGTKETVLTGIDLAAYKDPETGMDLKALLRLLESADTPPRIRLSSLDPGFIDDALIGILGSSQKLARSVHIPLQSGSDRILEKMGRKYRCAQVRSVVGQLRDSVEDVGIGMDVMVGFPGEDEAAFQETYTLIDSLDIYYLHVFHYSDRKGTKASVMEDKVAESVKKGRVKLLKRLDSRKRATFQRGFVGKEVSIIPEGKIYRGTYMRGYTSSYVPVYIPFQKTLENNLIDVKIRGMEQNLLIGEK